VGVVLVGISHRTAPVELREKMSFDAESTLRGLEELSRRASSAEAVILSTCNRVEVTAFRDSDDDGLIASIEDFFARFHALDPSLVAPCLYRLRGMDAGNRRSSPRRRTPTSSPPAPGTPGNI
jgi:glutamyl-tRNA reductase